MLISVVGASGSRTVAGVPLGHPAALVRVVAERPDRAVVVLTSRQAAPQVRAQAELVLAARPSTRIEIVTSAHHALTLMVVACRVSRTITSQSSTAEVLARLDHDLTLARSLLWCSSAWRLRVAGLGLRQRLRSMATATGTLVELAPDARLIERDSWPVDDGDQLYVNAQVPAPLADLLTGRRIELTPIEVESTPVHKSARLLSVLPRASSSHHLPIDHPAQKSDAA